MQKSKPNAKTPNKRWQRRGVFALINDEDREDFYHDPGRIPRNPDDILLAQDMEDEDRNRE